MADAWESLHTSHLPSFSMFTEGFASDYGLDGSIFAITTNSIVVVIQYHLGALGFMAPDGNTNLALKDMINAMKFLPWRIFANVNKLELVAMGLVDVKEWCSTL
ncbi:hypothetical protein IW261DRAFT_1569714 [Armillaria novae-zelandiae]|uniref:Carboxylesterase type B domain-containing protein n=1 Tax=Armillaria novae-zelandiae TaxID=153914 RepID=A0AA39NXC0_9AGAR|nr:hypothetical protein IW261DRAFT_1569714 [Armillaria novae-zelandiae]